MEKNDHEGPKRTITLQNGVTVTLHYAEHGPSLESRMVSILCSHMAQT